MQVIGLCRFSYPGLGGFQIEHASLEERTAFLYAPRRLEERFRFFETFTLPSIRAQTDPDFTFLIVIGESLPNVHRRRLEDLTSDVPQAVIQSHPPRRHRSVMKDAINSVRHRGTEPGLQFRLDDDDAVGIRFVERLREVAALVRPMMSAHSHIAIDFNQGYVAQPGPHGINALAVQKPYWTPALALMMRPEFNRTIMNFGHHRVFRDMPTVTMSREDMMLRGHNDFNDSRQKAKIEKFRLAPLTAEEEAHFRTVYNIDADHVRRVFSGSC